MKKHEEHVSDARIQQIVTNNLIKLVSTLGIKQNELKDVLGITSKSTISYYLNKDSDNIPSTLSLYRLKEYFGISIDEFLSPDFSPTKVYGLCDPIVNEYKKFAGVYELYYLTTSKISDSPQRRKDFNKNSEVRFGTLAIVKDADNDRNNNYKSYACFFKDRDEAAALKRLAEEKMKASDLRGVAEAFTSRDRYCEGKFELIQNSKYYSVSMTGYSVSDGDDDEKKAKKINDTILFIGFNPDNTNITSYLGGAVLSTSLSRGNMKTPCSQITVLSRRTLTEKPEVIRDELLNNARINAPTVAIDDIMSRYNALKNNEFYSEEDKEIILRAHVERQFNAELERASYHLFYLLNEYDKHIYDFISPD